MNCTKYVNHLKKYTKLYNTTKNIKYLNIIKKKYGKYNIDTIKLINILKKFSIDAIDLLTCNIIKKIQQQIDKNTILNFYGLYDPLIKVIYMDIEYIFRYKYGQDIAHKQFIKILNLDKYWGLMICPTG